MESKSNKELAIEAAIECSKSYNSTNPEHPVNPYMFIKILNDVYDTIKALDFR